MRIAYVHGFAGVSGSMLLGALVDAEAPLTAVQEGWQRLQLPVAEVISERVRCTDYTATRVRVTASHVDTFLSQYTYATFCEFIGQCTLPPRVRQRLLRLLAHFADAVTGVHGVPERGLAMQSAWMPTVLYLGSGVVTALEALAVEQLLAAPVNLGAGPHPLTAALMRGASVYGEPATGELTSVDGAAILTALSASFGPLPAMTVSRTGYGASAEATAGNVRGLQVLLGDVEAQSTAERIAVLEANIDDMNPEFYEVIFARVLAQGALDVMLTPVLMKKGRPGHKLTVLAPLAMVASLSRVILQETSTFGVRVYDVWRQKLARFVRQADTCYGVIPVKCGVLDGRMVQAAPEYEACKRIALQQGIPIRLVYTEAARLAASWLIEPEEPDG
jgi:uncharacterized protein (DUF111 family)